MTSMLPDAVERERESLLKAVMRLLRGQGYDHFHALEIPGYSQPEALTIPVLNVRMTPDLHATHPSEGMLLGVAEPQSDLADTACGRRWQGLTTWAERHQARLRVYVHVEDESRARRIARHWHLDENLIQPVPRH